MNTNTIETKKKWALVKDLDDDLSLVTDSHEVEWILENIGCTETCYGSLFIRIQMGEYAEIWGMEGIVPHTHDWAYKII